jgi:putative heme-binding domain-containing protein
VRQALLPLALLLGPAGPAVAQTPLLKAPPGFRVELLLQAPDVEAPTALGVAPNGDVYFAEDPMDMGGPPTKNLDRIWLLKGGDPKKKVLFADRMWAVMALEVVGDKLYAVHAPHVTVFTLGADGKAKGRAELFDDLGPKVAGLPSFNDHIPSGIRMGMDGWLYVSIGDKGIPQMSRVPVPLRGTARGKEIEKEGSVHVAEGRWRPTKEGHHISLEGGGVIRFRPDGTGLEVFASGTRNHLDVPLDEHDRVVVRDNTDDGLGWNTRLMYLPHGGFLGYPWAYTRRPREALPMIHDFGGGSPCGGWVYLDDGLPETYRGRVFHCEWGQGKVWAVRLAPDGAGFKYVDQIAFLDPDGTGVKDFRPFTLRPTADGRGFYVTDWGYSGWLTKAKAGRLWKVTYARDDVKPAPRGKDGDGVEQLIKGLGHPAHGERLRCQRALAARGREVAAELERLVKEGKINTASPAVRRHLVWALGGLGPREVMRLAFVLWWDPDPEVRAEVVRMLSDIDPAQLPARTEAGKPGRDLYREVLLTSLKPHQPAPLRLQAAVACRRILDADAALVLLEHYGREPDAYVRHALVRTLRQAPWPELVGKLTPEWAAKADRRTLEGLCLALAEAFDPSGVVLLQRLASHPEVSVRVLAVATLARNYFDRKPYAGTWWGTQPAAQKPPARVVAWEGTPAVREAILKALGDKDAGVRRAAVAALTAANDPATFEPLAARYAEEMDAAPRADLVRAVAGLEAPETAAFLRGVLLDAKNSEELRLEAVAGLERAHAPKAAEALARVAVPREPAALQVRAIEALGALKAQPARPALTEALRSKEPAVRRAAAGALAKLGGAGAAASLLPLLRDPEIGVRTAAIQALGALKAKSAVPALVQVAGDEATQFDAVMALAQVPDARALAAYLAGLTSKNVELRQACRQALAAVRDEVAPALEQLARGNEIPAAAFPELREVFSSFIPITSWRLIGPFPRDGQAHPPEKEQKFDAAYQGAEQVVKWQAVRADARDHGRVDLAARFSPNTQVVAYGYAEIDSAAARDATLLVGSDDTITVWLNGQKVHDFPGDRGWAFNQDRVPVRLGKGKNRLLVECGNSGGPWEFSVALSAEADPYAFLKGGAKKYDLETFRAFARKNPGDAARGAKLFADLKGLACVKCHAVAGQGGRVGPDLAGIRLKYKREDLMTSLLEPSKVIAQGYETIVISTVKGKTISGVFKGETADAVNVADAEGKLHTVAKKDIDERTFSPVSVMPNGLNEGMTLQDFADVIAFLEARREETAPPKK